MFCHTCVCVCVCMSLTTTLKKIRCPRPFKLLYDVHEHSFLKYFVTHIHDISILYGSCESLQIIRNTYITTTHIVYELWRKVEEKKKLKRKKNYSILWGVTRIYLWNRRELKMNKDFSSSFFYVCVGTLYIQRHTHEKPLTLYK